MFRWFADRRRRRLARAPFPTQWEEALRRNAAPFGLLDEDGKARLRALIQVFVAEKNWEGAGGLEITDEIRVTIAAHACLLLLGLSHDYYRNVQSIIVYPSAVVPPRLRPGFFETTLEPLEQEEPIEGEAHDQGPVIIAWDAALQSARRPGSGQNVVYHEFAHKLDTLDGSADGTPPLRDRDEYQDWVRTCSREYLRLKKNAERGRESFLDDYGATDEAEFFAVATEQFFDRPQFMLDWAPELYRVLRRYYGQDPVKHVPGKDIT
jgi:hypothetical protein